MNVSQTEVEKYVAEQEKIYESKLPNFTIIQGVVKEISGKAAERVKNGKYKPCPLQQLIASVAIATPG